MAGEVEMRLSTFPTVFGEKAVVRMFAAPGRFLRLDDLGLPAEVRDGLSHVLDETSGAIVLAGPGGQRQDDHDLRLPARAGGAAGPASAAWRPSKTPSRPSSRASRRRRSTRPPG